MKLISVRRGQFVYYNNKLHKVYSVKPFFKQSVHLIRLEDYEQQLATAAEIDLCRPEHLDSFICNHRRYTLNKHTKAKVGDYILVINPRPDSMDDHHLNAIEMVSSIESNGVISNKSNGIKHNEYWVMVPGIEDGANFIDLQTPNEQTFRELDDMEPTDISQTENYIEKILQPKIGDVFQKNDSKPIIQTAVVAIKDQTVYLGGGLEVSIDELSDREKWSYLINVLEQ